MMGWQCPCCRRVYAPTITHCDCQHVPPMWPPSTWVYAPYQCSTTDTTTGSTTTFKDDVPRTNT